MGLICYVPLLTDNSGLELKDKFEFSVPKHYLMPPFPFIASINVKHTDVWYWTDSDSEKLAYLFHLTSSDSRNTIFILIFASKFIANQVFKSYH